MKIKTLRHRTDGRARLFSSAAVSHVETHFAKLFELARLSLALVPILMGLVAVALAILLVQAVPTGGGRTADAWWHFKGSAEDAADFLSNLLASLVGMTGLVVSITMVVLTLAAAQLGPRLIRSFIEDWRTKVVLGWFLATIVYLLVTVHAMKASDSPQDIPQSAVFAGLVLWGSCAFLLFVYVDHLARSIIADTIIARTGRVLDERACEIPEPDRSEADEEVRFCEEDAAPFSLPEGGYVQLVDYHALVDLAAKGDFTLSLLFHPGAHLLSGGSHVRISPAGALTDELQREIGDAVAVGEVRTPDQDVEFSLRQLVEIALRALSPALNDPFTAIAVIDRLALSLSDAVRRPDAAAAWADETGAVRLFAPSPRFEDLLDASFNQIRQSASTYPAILIRLLEKLGQLSELTEDPARRQALARHARMILEAGRREISEPHDQETLEARFCRATTLLPALAQEDGRTGEAAEGRMAEPA